MPSSEKPHHSETADRSPCLALDELVIQLGSFLLRLEAPCRLPAGRLYLLYGDFGQRKIEFRSGCWGWEH